MNFAPFLYKNFNWRKMDGTYSRYKEKIGTTRFPEYDNLKVLKSMEFENLIDNRVFMTLENKANYEFVKQDLIRLKTLIENGIDPLNK